MEKDKFIPQTTCTVECVEKIDLEQFKEFWNVEPSCKIQSIPSTLCLKLLSIWLHVWITALLAMAL
ncbi:hypothetical protein [Paenibacillus sp. ALJ109b]|uniref:hypothetical protein n=1 Tax=Paenibacillus sp. ALJ109b TaxID=2709068 RepID=UPI00196881AF|nr:hypothetical protein [Paenibacillus sp. ALJ109b]